MICILTLIAFSVVMLCTYWHEAVYLILFIVAAANLSLHFFRCIFLDDFLLIVLRFCFRGFIFSCVC